MRLLQEWENDNEWTDAHSESIPFSMDENREDDTGSDDINITRPATVKVISVDRNIIKKHDNKNETVNRKTRQSKGKIYPDEIHQWANYIDGKTQSRPKTLISENHPETAADKPIIPGTCQGHESKILCDSGADVNVIDEGLLHEIQSVDRTIQLKKSSRMIKCANNSRMPVAGTIVLEMKFPSITKYCKFLVVKNLFPRVIIGMRAMKSLKMTIDPPRDRVVVNGLGIPFLSKTKNESIDQGNVRKSVL